MRTVHLLAALGFATLVPGTVFADSRTVVSCGPQKVWNSTDASRQLEGIPGDGVDQCVVYDSMQGSAWRAIYSNERQSKRHISVQ